MTDKTRINDREWVTTQGTQRKMRKMDWQNKSQWHWGVDNTRYWDHKSDREKCVWKRIDRRRVNDQRVTENTSLRPQVGWQRTSKEKGLTTEQESITESDKVTKPEWKPEEVWDRGKDSEHNYEKQQRERQKQHTKRSKGFLNNKLCWASKSQWVREQESQNKNLTSLSKS